MAMILSVRIDGVFAAENSPPSRTLVIPEAGLPEIFDFAGKPRCPGSRKCRDAVWIPDLKARAPKARSDFRARLTSGMTHWKALAFIRRPTSPDTAGDERSAFGIGFTAVSSRFFRPSR